MNKNSKMLNICAPHKYQFKIKAELSLCWRFFINANETNIFYKAKTFTFNIYEHLTQKIDKPKIQRAQVIK